MSIKCNLNVSKKIGMGNQPITELSFRKARKEGTSICGFVLPYSGSILFEDKHAISGIQKSILGKKNAKGSDLHLMAKFSKWKTGEVFQKYFAETIHQKLDSTAFWVIPLLHSSMDRVRVTLF